MLPTHGVLDYNQMTWEVDANSESRCATNHTDLSVEKAFFYSVSILAIQARVVESHT